jgi:hypothetical protein
VAVSLKSGVLIECHVDNKHIVEWVREPFMYNNIVAATKWWNQYMLPAIEALQFFIDKYGQNYWTRMQACNKSHPDLKLLAEKRQLVREMWFKRPRFPGDKGRSTW